MTLIVEIVVLLSACTVCSEVMALTNYSLPFVGGAAPYLQQGSPFVPRPAYGQPPQVPRRNPYTPPTYLPPSPDSPNYREPERNYNERNNNYYGNYDGENANAERNNNGDYFDRSVSGNSASGPPVRKTPAYAEQGSQGAQNAQGAQPAQGSPAGPTEYPGRPSGFTRVQGTHGAPGNRAQLHAVLDYDEDYYEDDSESGSQADGGASYPGTGGQKQAATPIQGPIFLKNGSVPVVPLYSYPVINNGSFVQIPILWSALSVALGLEVRGQLIRGVPCVKRFHQLFCPTGGNTYPTDRIDHFIDENKALMKRMYGDFTVFTEYGPPVAGGGRARRMAPGVPDPIGLHEDDFAGHSHASDKPGTPISFEEHIGKSARQTRQASGKQSQTTPPFLNPNQGNSSGRIDACESKMEIVTPYWALNSAGKVRAVVNTMHFEQAIHQEVCSKTQTHRCAGECGCEQKYKWHRLLAYDPDQDCAGIFMDWFLFPSCCVCRCSP